MQLRWLILIFIILILSFAVAGLSESSGCRMESSAITWGSGGDDQADDIAIDEQGNMYVAGTFEGIVDFDPGQNEFLLDGGSNRTAFIAAYDGDLNYRWAHAMERGKVGWSDWCVAVADDGSVFVSGITSSDSDEGTDIYIAKFESSGQESWSTIHPVPGVGYPNGISVDRQSNVYVAGTYHDSPEGDYPWTMGFILKYSSEGDEQWSLEIGEEGYGAAANDIAVSAGGECYICGNYDKEIIVEINGNQEVLGSQNGSFSQPFVLKTDSDGEVEWISDWASSGFSDCHRIALHRLGDLLVAGSFKGQITYLWHEMPDQILSVPDGSHDVFFAGLSPDGEVRWMNSWGTDNLDGVYSVAVDPNDEGIIFCSTLGTLEEPGIWNTFLSISSSGDIDKESTFKGTTFTDFAVLDVDSYALTGYFIFSFDFDLGYGIDIRKANDGFDAFLMKLHLNE